ncbi:hypothetical protein [Pseudarthrobacter sp. NamE5]|uniref:hypothetical protein n=1 Tax=Pseudarthrobacter sp. NamE5 TaxID=2576839 RepID=UPI001485D24E|nr:hypothetical protein [Pseudarthrobacter sp. NamE5]
MPHRDRSNDYANSVTQQAATGMMGGAVGPKCDTFGPVPALIFLSACARPVRATH